MSRWSHRNDGARSWVNVALGLAVVGASALAFSVGGISTARAGSAPTGMFSAVPVPSSYPSQPYQTCLIGLEGNSPTSGPAPEDWYVRSTVTGTLEIDVFAVTLGGPNTPDTNPSGGIVATLYDDATPVGTTTAFFQPQTTAQMQVVSPPSPITISAVMGGVYHLQVSLAPNSSEEHYELGFTNNSSRPDVGIMSPSFSNFEPTNGYTFYMNAAAGQGSLSFTVQLPGGNQPTQTESNFNVTVTDTVAHTTLLTATNQTLPYNATVSNIPNEPAAHALRVDVAQVPVFSGSNGHFRLELTNADGSTPLATGDPGIYVDSCPPQQGPGNGAPYGAKSIRTDGAFLDSSIDSVGAGATLASNTSNSTSANRQWQLSVTNNTGSSLNGAQVAIDDSTTTCSAYTGGMCPTLNNANQFDFRYTNPSMAGNQSNGPGQTACQQMATATQETCPTPGVTVMPNSAVTVSTTPSSPGGVGGVPISMTTGYDSSRTFGATGNNGDAPLTVAVTLNDSRYQVAGNNNQVFVNTFFDNVDPSSVMQAPSSTVTANGSPVPPCSQGQNSACVQMLQVRSQQFPKMGGGTVTCNSVGLYLQNAQDGNTTTTYDLNVQENETPGTGCPIGKPAVSISADSQVPLFASPMPSCTTNTDCATTQPDPALGNVTFSVGSNQGVTGFQYFQETNYSVQYNAPGGGGGCTGNCGPGPQGVIGVAQRYDTIDVGDDTNSVPWNRAYPDASYPNAAGCSNDNAAGQGQVESGCVNWQFQMGNQGNANLTGAQVAVDSTGTGLDLSNPSQFNWMYMTQNPNSQGGCPSPSTNHESCPVPGAALAAASNPQSPGAQLTVSTSNDPQMGVPMPGSTAGYDSQRNVLPPATAGTGPTATGGNGCPTVLSAPPAGVSWVCVPVTLQDPTRYGQGETFIGVSSYNGNVTQGPGTAMILNPDGTTVGPCGQMSNAACTVMPQYQTCQNTGCPQQGQGQTCTDVGQGVRNAALGTTYTIAYQEYVANTTSLTTGNCGSVKSAVRIDVDTNGAPSPPTQCSMGVTCSATVNDAVLGSITFSATPDQNTQLQAQFQGRSVVQYAPERNQQVFTTQQFGSGLVATEGVPFSGQLASFSEDGPDASSAGDYTATISWCDGTSSAGTVTGPLTDQQGGTFFLVSGSHTYADEGTCAAPHPGVSVTVTDVDTGWSSGTTGTRATILDAALTATGNQAFNAGSPGSNAEVATFSDANSGATCNDFNGTDKGPNGNTPGSITVTWGGASSSSGTSTPGSCAQSGSGSFVVTSSNAPPGLHSVTVHIVDDGGQTLTITSTVDIATGAGSIGFWKNSNGQGIITTGASTGGVCNAGTWLRGYTPFQDLSKSASCSAVASYVNTVMSAASASGTSMNAQLKAQMLATALDVYFSSSTLGGNRLHAPVPIGSLTIDLAGICTTVDSSGSGSCSGGFNSLSAEESAFGTTNHCISVTQMLARQNSVSNAGGTTWYGNVKSTQQLAKDAFDLIDNQLAPTC